MCKKGCYRAAIAVDENKDYKNVCISSPNFKQNIYSFCEDKFTTFSPKLLNVCKLDMCNLCCVGMDSIKKKNYSLPNLKTCFIDCSKSYNVVIDDRSIESTKDGPPAPEECNSAHIIDSNEVNKEEKVETSFLVNSYMKYMEPNANKK